MSKVRDGVANAEEGSVSGQYSYRRDFADAEAAEGISNSLEGLLAAMSSQRLHILRLDTPFGLDLGRDVLEQGPRGHLVLRAWPAGRTITGGNIFLPYSSVLLLTGAGVRFEDTVFVGRGLIVCCGDGFSATFKQCQIRGGTLYAVHGATVNLDRCCLTTSPFGLVAHGHATCATVHSCSFKHCQTAVVAERGATVVMHKCSAVASRSVVKARDPSTHVICKNSHLHASAGPPSMPWKDVGVEVRDACVALRRCSVWGFQRGVRASGSSAAAELRDCIVEASLCGVSALDGASIALRNTDMRLVDVPVSVNPADDQLSPSLVAARPGRGAGRGGHMQIERSTLGVEGRVHDGVLASGGGRIDIRGSEVTSPGNCVTAFERGIVVASHCELHSEAGVACGAEDGGSVIRVVGGTLAGVAAVQCTAGAALTARSTAMAGQLEARVHQGPVVAAQYGAVLRMLECTVSHAGYGVIVMGATCFSRDVAVSHVGISRKGCAKIGYEQSGGRLSVKGGCVQGCAIGMSVSYLGGAYGPAYTDLDGVLFDANLAAMQVGGGTTLVVSDCVFTGGPGPCELEVGDCIGNGYMTIDSIGLFGKCESTLWVDNPGLPCGAWPWKQEIGKGCVESGELGQTALYITDDAGPATVTGCTFQNSLQDVRFHGKHGLDLSECTFAGEACGCCVSLNGRACVTGCTFSAAACAVFVRARGCAVTGCWMDPTVEQGVLVDGGAEATVAGCTIEAHGNAIEASHQSMVAVMDCDCLGAGVGMRVTCSSEVQAERLAIRGGAVAVQVAAGGGEKSTVRLTECVISGASDVGLLLTGGGAGGAMEGCKVMECNVGVLVKPGGLARVCSTVIAQCEGGVVVGTLQDMPAHASVVREQSGAAAAAVEAPEQLHMHAGWAVPGVRYMRDRPSAAAMLRAVDVLGCRAGVQVHATGWVDAERVEVRGAAAAFTVTRIGPASRFQQCKALGGAAPAVTARQLLLSGSSLQYKLDDITGIAVEDDCASVEG